MLFFFVHFVSTSFCANLCGLFCNCVDIDVAAQGVDRAAAIATRFAAAQPEDTGQDPIAIGKLRAQWRRVDFAGGSAADEHGVGRATGPDLDADAMPATRRAATAVGLARAVQRGGDRVLLQYAIIFA